MIIFEAMSRVDVLRACFAALAGERVFYIKKPLKAARRMLGCILRIRFFRKRIKPSRITWTKDYFDGVWGDRAFLIINDVYAQIAESYYVMKLTKRFDLTAEMAIKKELTTLLSRFLYLNAVLSIIDKRFNVAINFVPSLGIDCGYYVTAAQDAVCYSYLRKIVHAAGVSTDCHSKVSFSRLSFIYGGITLIVELVLRHIRMIGRIVKYFFIALKNSIFSKPRSKAWRYAVMIMSCARQFQNDIEGLGFIIDGKKITKEQVVFIPHSFVRLGEKECAYMRRKNFNYIKNLNDYYSLSQLIEMMQSCFLGILCDKPFFLKVTYELSMESAIWKSFSSQVNLANVIGNHDVSVSALCRNAILFKQHKTQSWLYIDSNNFPVFFIPENEYITYKTNFYSFMIYNNVVCWNKKLEEIFLTLENKVDVYFQSGCLWSTFIKRKITSSKSVNNSSKITIAVFDSSYHDYSVSSPKCAYFFYKGILRLLKEMDNVRILFKPKKAKSYYETVCGKQAMFREINKLKQHPRCEEVDYNTPRCEVIVQADLVIAFPFTSPAFEAICAGVPAIYYDAIGSFPESIYQGCGIVASGYDELIEKIEYFLSLPKDDFYKWMVKNKLIFDEYLDGQGLDRFIKKLSGST